MSKQIDTSVLHNLVAKREDAYRKYMEAVNEYHKACEELRNNINNLNDEESATPRT